MFEWITQIDYEILVFIQEHLRFDWLTGTAGIYQPSGKCRAVLDRPLPFPSDFQADTEDGRLPGCWPF